MPKPSTSAAVVRVVGGDERDLGVELAAAVAPQQVDAGSGPRSRRGRPSASGGRRRSSRQSMSSRSRDLLRERARRARRGRRCSSVNSIRMKNSPPSGSVECWSERDDVRAGVGEEARRRAATMPCRSGQVMSRRPFMPGAEATSASASARVLGERVAAAGRQQRVDVALRAVALDRPQLDAARTPSAPAAAAPA